MKEIKQKEVIYQSIMAETNSYSDELHEFLQQHNDINIALANGNYKNQTCQYFTEVLTAFRRFLNSNSSSPLTPFEQSSAQQQPSPPQMINLSEAMKSIDSGAILLDDGQTYPEQVFVEEVEENDGT